MYDVHEELLKTLEKAKDDNVQTGFLTTLNVETGDERIAVLGTSESVYALGAGVAIGAGFKKIGGSPEAVELVCAFIEGCIDGLILASDSIGAENSDNINKVVWAANVLEKLTKSVELRELREAIKDMAREKLMAARDTFVAELNEK